MLIMDAIMARACPNPTSTFQKAVSLGIFSAFLYSTISAPFAEANLWSERKSYIEKQNKKSSDGAITLASLPFSQASALNIPSSLQDFSVSEIATSSRNSQILKGVEISPALEKILPLVSSLNSFGTLRKITTPATKKGENTQEKIVLHIQDVHLNPEVQKNIGKSVQELIHSGQVDLVALEGAFEPMDFTRFRNFPHQEAIRKVADYLLRQNKISGAVHTAYSSPHTIPPFVGVDDSSHYDANVEAYRQSVPLMQSCSQEISKMMAALEQEKQNVFDPELKEFDSCKNQYETGEIKLGDWLEKLSKSPQSLNVPNISKFLKASRMEKTLDFNQVEKERASLIYSLVKTLSPTQIQDLTRYTLAFRSNQIQYGDYYSFLRDICKEKNVFLSQYPAMDRYIQYVLLSDSIDSGNLFNEIRELENERYKKLARTQEEKHLLAKSKQISLTKKLTEFSLAPNEWEEYAALKWDVILSPALPNLTPFKNFYQEAKLRDEAMTGNLLKQVEKTDAQLTLLVTGGFHSAGMEKKLTEKGMTVLNFVPNMTKVDTKNGAAYLSVFTRE
ncbi:MAG: hypothetical protein HYY63_00920, partial [Elusimicrobia bacterium]|nr:hypothetical protein [Elusimicrobiota bacterium]